MSLVGWSDSFLRAERIAARDVDALAMDAEIERRRIARASFGAMAATFREIRAAAVAAGDWDRVQLCDVAAHGVASPDERIEIGGRRYNMTEARAVLGIGGAQ